MYVGIKEPRFLGIVIMRLTSYGRLRLLGDHDEIIIIAEPDAHRDGICAPPQRSALS